MMIRFGATPPVNPLAARRAAALQQQRDNDALVLKQAEEARKNAEFKGIIDSCKPLLVADVLPPVLDIPGMNGVEVLTLLSDPQNRKVEVRPIELAGAERAGFYFTKDFLTAQGFDRADIEKILVHAEAMSKTGILNKTVGKVEGQQQITQEVIRGYDVSEKGRKLLGYLATNPLTADGASPVAAQ